MSETPPSLTCLSFTPTPLPLCYHRKRKGNSVAERLVEEEEKEEEKEDKKAREKARIDQLWASFKEDTASPSHKSAPAKAR
jgi:hypothetical protein